MQNNVKKLEALSAVTTIAALILTVVGISLAGIGGFGFISNVMTESYDEASPFGVVFWIGLPLFVIGIILFIVEAIIEYKLKRLAKKSESGAAINKDNAPADNER